MVDDKAAKQKQLLLLFMSYNDKGAELDVRNVNR